MNRRTRISLWVVGIFSALAVAFSIIVVLTSIVAIVDAAVCELILLLVFSILLVAFYTVGIEISRLLDHKH